MVFAGLTACPPRAKNALLDHQVRPDFNCRRLLGKLGRRRAHTLALHRGLEREQNYMN